MKRLLLLLLAFPAFAADITATSITCSDTIPASITIDAGSNRQLFFSITEGDSTPAADIATVGGQGETETFTHAETTPEPDHQHQVWIWNESAIAAMSGSTVVGTEGGSDNQFCWGVVDDADQTALGSHTGTNYGASVTTLAVTTTSTSNDYVVVTGETTQSARTYDGCDTLTEYGDSNGGGNDKHLLCGGTGGDNSTTVTVSSAAELSLASLVFLNATAATDDWLRTRR